MQTTQSGRLMKDRTVELLRIPARDLLADPRNWRDHPPVQRNALEALLGEIGFAGAVLARRDAAGALILIDGHLRGDQIAAQFSPDQKVPVLVLDVDEQEAGKILATYDPLSGMATMNPEKLAALLGDLDSMKDELSKLVWPDYVRDALSSADWTPPAKKALDTHNRHATKEIELTEAQHLVVMEGVARIREASGGVDMTDGRALELLVADWLDVRGDARGGSLTLKVRP